MNCLISSMAPYTEYKDGYENSWVLTNKIEPPEILSKAELFQFACTDIKSKGLLTSDNFRFIYYSLMSADQYICGNYKDFFKKQLDLNNAYFLAVIKSDCPLYIDKLTDNVYFYNFKHIILFYKRK